MEPNLLRNTSRSTLLRNSALRLLRSRGNEVFSTLQTEARSELRTVSANWRLNSARFHKSLLDQRSLSFLKGATCAEQTRRSSFQRDCRAPELPGGLSYPSPENSPSLFCFFGKLRDRTGSLFRNT